MNLRFLMVSCWLSLQANAQQVQELPLSAHLKAYDTNVINALVVQVNPAAAPYAEKLMVTVYGSRLYQLRALQIVTASVILPLKPMYLGGSIHFLGGEGYGSTSLTFTAARSLGKGTAAGINIGYEKIITKGYAMYSTLSAAGGGMWHLNDFLNAGLVWKMKYAGKLNGYLTDYGAGFSYKLAEQLVLAAELLKPSGTAASLSAGVFFEIKKGYDAHLGFSSGNGSLFFELEISLATLNIAISTSFHQPLGLSPGLLFSYLPTKAP